MDSVIFTVRRAAVTAYIFFVYLLKSCYMLYLGKKPDPIQHTVRNALCSGMCMSSGEWLNKDCQAECCGIRQLLSMYSQNGKHDLGKKLLYVLQFYESNVEHACHVQQGVTAL
jgi:hypothetical protein